MKVLVWRNMIISPYHGSNDVISNNNSSGIESPDVVSVSAVGRS